MSADAKLKRPGPDSIAPVVTAALVTVITLVLGGFGVVNYRSALKEHWNALHVQVKANADQVAAGLALPVWNFLYDQIERVVESIFKDPVIVAIRLHENDGREPDMLWVRDSGRAVRKADVSTNGLLREDRVIRTSPDSVLGIVKVFATPALVQAEMRQHLVATIGRIVGVDAVLSLVLYLVLRRWVIHPLKALERFAKAVSSGAETWICADADFTGS